MLKSYLATYSNSMLNSEIARRAGRSYVFTPFIWNPDVGEDGYFEGLLTSHLVNSKKLRPGRVPLRAYIDSPTSGAPWPEGDPLQGLFQLCGMSECAPRKNGYG